MVCCKDMDLAIYVSSIRETEKHLIDDGRLMNDVDSTFFIRSTSDSGRTMYLAVNYCPFCGRAVSRGLWQAEKKK